MTAAVSTLVLPDAPPTLRAVPPLPPAVRSDGLIKVRMVPLVRTPGEHAVTDFDSESTEAMVDQQLIVDYTAALARRTAANVRDGNVERVEHWHQHPHPSVATCLRCAVLGTSTSRTLAMTLLQILTDTHADESWNNDASVCTDTKIVSRLRRLAISHSTMESLHGRNWGAVLLTCLRAERCDFELLRYLTRNYQSSRVMVNHSWEAMAASHLGQAACPWVTRDGKPVNDTRRGAVAIPLGCAVAQVAIGEAPDWLDHLPAPAL